MYYYYFSYIDIKSQNFTANFAALQTSTAFYSQFDYFPQLIQLHSFRCSLWKLTKDFTSLDAQHLNSLNVYSEHNKTRRNSEKERPNEDECETK